MLLILGSILLLRPTKAEAPLIKEPDLDRMILIQGNSVQAMANPLHLEDPIEIEAILTMYNPTWQQTDSTPEITASGQKVREGIVANNCWAFGTLVEIDGKTFEIQDRMNKRFGCECFDILTFSLSGAQGFGRQIKTVRIYK